MLNVLQGHHEWITEVHFLGIVDNPYVVKLIGYCADDEGRRLQRLLVYEYMPNKGLDDHLFRTSPTVLSWQTRVKIALGAAKGLAYLHEDKEVSSSIPNASSMPRLPCSVSRRASAGRAINNCGLSGCG